MIIRASILLLFIVLCLIGYSQDFDTIPRNDKRSSITIIPTKDGSSVHLDTIVRVDSVTKEELYFRAKLWFSDYFKSSKGVIDLDSEENGVIIGKGYKGIVVGNFIEIDTKCYFTVRLSLKDNKYRLEVYDVYYKPDNGFWIGNFYQPPVESYPSDWFLPLGNERQKLRITYLRQTIIALNSIFDSLLAKMENREGNTDDW